MRKFICIIVSVLSILSFSIEGAKPAVGKKGGAVRKSRNIAKTLDSIHWLIERHCDNKIESMGRDDGTIDQIKRKFRSLPANTADSLLSAQYDGIVRLFEEERNNRAFALTDCYYALAKDDDPNLGALYLNDMVLAIERNDSVLLRTRMNELKAYADRNNLDYDQDLEDAEVNMRQLRQRIAFKNTPFDDFLLNDGNSIFWVLDKSAMTTPIPTEFILAVPDYIFLGVANKMYGRFALDVKKEKNKVSPYTPMMFHWPYSEIIKDDENKHYFASYSTEKGGTTNPELLASGRQLVQNLHAKVSGELARKKYSYGQRFGGELAATAVDVGLNALFSYLSVTTQHAYTSTINLTMTAPDLLEGEMYVAHVAVKSNNPGNPKTTQAVIPLRFYRTYPKEDLHLINQKCEPIYNAEMDRPLFEQEHKKYKLKEKAWKAKQAEWKKANKGKKPQYDKYYEFHNDSVMNILRERAESSFERIEL